MCGRNTGKMHKTPQSTSATTTTATTSTASKTESHTHTLSHITKALASSDIKTIPTKERDDIAADERERDEEEVGVGEGEGKGDEESDARVEKRACLEAGVEMDREADEG